MAAHYQNIILRKVENQFGFYEENWKEVVDTFASAFAVAFFFRKTRPDTLSARYMNIFVVIWTTDKLFLEKR